jgi:GTP-binding protein
MIVGENSRPDDMDVNITRERKVTNVRQSTGEELERLVPPRLLSLEQALEFCADDECVEVTAHAVRLRKTTLDARERARARGRASRGALSAARGYAEPRLSSRPCPGATAPGRGAVGR